MKKLSVVMLTILLALSLVGCLKTIPQTNIEQPEDILPQKNIDELGGTIITYQIVANEGEDVDDEMMDDCINIMTERLELIDYSNATFLKSGDCIIVELPEVYAEGKATEISHFLGSIGKLEFQNADGEVVMSGNMIKGAIANYGSVGNGTADEHHIVLEFTNAGKKRFAEVTADAASREYGENYISILLDGTIISQPTVQEAINGDTCTISGSFTREDAAELAAIIDSGNLEFNLDQLQMQRVDPPEKIKKKLEKEEKEKFESLLAKLLNKKVSKINDSDYGKVKYMEVINNGDNISVYLGDDDFYKGYKLYVLEQKMIENASEYGNYIEPTIEFPIDLAVEDTFDFIYNNLIKDNLEKFENLEVLYFAGDEIDIKKLAKISSLKSITFDGCTFVNEKYFQYLDEDTIEEITLSGIGELDWDNLWHLKDKVSIYSIYYTIDDSGSIVPVSSTQTLAEYLAASDLSSSEEVEEEVEENEAVAEEAEEVEAEDAEVVVEEDAEEEYYSFK